MKEHYKNLFIHALNELQLSLDDIHDMFRICGLLYYPDEPFASFKKLEKLSSEIIASLSDHETRIKKANFNPDHVKYSVSQIKNIIETDCEIIGMEYNNIFPLLQSKTDPLILLGKRKNILRKLDALIYESNNLIMIPHFENVIPFKKELKRKRHLTLVKG